MILQTALLTALLLVACSHEQELVFPGDEGLGINAGDNVFYGDNYFFKLATPRGWVVDHESGKPAGLAGVFYPAGSSFAGPIAAYPRAVPKGGLTFDGVLARDLADYQEASPEASFVEAPDLLTEEERTAKVRQFTAYDGQVHELVAYVDEPLVVVMIVLRAPDKGTLKELTPLFEALVRSYRAAMRGKEPFSFEGAG